MTEKLYIEYLAHMLDESMCDKTSLDLVEGNEKYATAVRVKNDEWYTRYEDVEKLLKPFQRFLSGKKILCNCDDPERSDTFKYLKDNFSIFGIERIVCIGYNAPKKAIMTSSDDVQFIDSPSNGDMNSEDSLREAKEADVIVSNPPFSRQEGQAINMFQQFIQIAYDNNCDVIGIGPTESIKEKVIKPKILKKELFVYPAPDYKFDRAGENILNAKGQVKNVVQVSIYSSFKVDGIKPQIKFSDRISIQQLPTADDGISITVNLEKSDSYDPLVKADAFSSLLIPIPTVDTLGEKIWVPFNIIDFDYESWFDLIDITNKKHVDGRQSGDVHSAMLLRYSNASQKQKNITGKRDVRSPIANDTIIIKFQMMKSKVDELVSQLLEKDNKTLGNKLYRLKADYQHKYKVKSKSGQNLAASFYKKCYEYIDKVNDQYHLYSVKHKVNSGSSNDILYLDQAMKNVYDNKEMDFKQKIDAVQNRINYLTNYAKDPSRKVRAVAVNAGISQLKALRDCIRIQLKSSEIIQQVDNASLKPVELKDRLLTLEKYLQGVNSMLGKMPKNVNDDTLASYEVAMQKSNQYISSSHKGKRRVKNV